MIRPAAEHARELMASLGIPDTSHEAAVWHTALLERVRLMILEAEVDPALGTPPMTTSAGPVVGRGRVV